MGKWEEGGAEGRWVEAGAVEQREGGEVGGEWCRERWVVQSDKGEAVGHVILLFQPPN